jgi:glycerate kinase
MVMEAMRLPQRMEGADLAVTGEGTFDEQSLRGKAPAGVLRVAREAGVAAVILCGRRTVDPGTARIFALADRFGVEAAMDRTAPLLEELAAEVAGDLAREGSSGRSR